MARTEVCSACRYCEPPPETIPGIAWADGAVGNCRRNPPIPHGVWPSVGKSDWCGEFKAGADHPEEQAAAEQQEMKAKPVAGGSDQAQTQRRAAAIATVRRRKK